MGSVIERAERLNASGWLSAHAAPILVTFGVGSFFLFSTWPALFIRFDQDDLMNLMFAWVPPLKDLLGSLLFPFTSYPRPTGSLYYRACYAVFGWDAGAFRSISYVFAALNVVLVYLLGRKLTGLREVGALGALIFSFHGRLLQIYTSNGTVFDVLCCTFSLAAIIWYLRIRDAERSTRWWEWVVLYVLFAAALNAKEMAATLPAILLIYEWLFHPPHFFRVSGVASWARRRATPSVLLALVALGSAWAKTHSGLLHNQPAYAWELTLRRFFENQRLLVGDLFYSSTPKISALLVVVAYSMQFAIAALIRKRDLWLLAWFTLLTPLPILFIPARGFFVMYFPYVGWALFAGAALTHGREWLWRSVWKRPRVPEGDWQPERLLLFAAIAALMIHARTELTAPMQQWDPNARIVGATVDDIFRLNEPLPPGARILLLNSRFPDVGWGPLMLFRLLYHDRKLDLDRPTMMQQPPSKADYASYDRVMDFTGLRMVTVSRRETPSRGSMLRPH